VTLEKQEDAASFKDAGLGAGGRCPEVGARLMIGYHIISLCTKFLTEMGRPGGLVV